MCEEGEDFSSVLTLLNGAVQVCHELVGEEEEKEEEQGQQEDREVEREKVKVKRPHTWMTMWMGEGARLKLEPNVSMDEMCKRR